VLQTRYERTRGQTYGSRRRIAEEFSYYGETKSITIRGREKSDHQEDYIRQRTINSIQSEFNAIQRD
jgi:hypothetical protein